jgi:GLPGLI family protein
MLKAITFLFSMVLVNIVIAQTPENSLVAVHYNCTYVVDSTQPGSPDKDEGVLYIGKKTSLYTSYSSILGGQKMNEELKGKLGNLDKALGSRTVNGGYPISFYKDVASNTLQSAALFKNNNYLLEEKIPEINWKISQETKMIGGYDCQKATTTFRGRTYEAWFCSKLPYNIGPWKLGGLPGLILEAYDTKKQFVFTFKSFEETSATSTPIQLPANMIKTTPRELLRAIEALAAEPSLFKKKQFNNPIEKLN